MADDFRLLVNFLGHEVAVIALVDHHHRRLRLHYGAMHDRAGGVVNFRAGAVEDDPVALLQIADRIGERRERDGIGADEHLVVAEADGERRAFARADQEIGLAREQKRQREGAA